jgi:general secretion pathway protein C
MLQRYFWVAYLVLVTLAAALAANMTVSYIGAKLTTPVAFEPELADQAPPQHTRLAQADYAIITERNIFNANPPSNDPKPVEVQPPPVAPQPIQETQLQLKLAGTVVGAQRQYNAIIEDLTQRGSQALYQVGDAIQNARIAEILPKCVVFDKRGTYERLCFPQADPSSNGQDRDTRTSSQLAPADSESEDEDIVQVDNATWRVSRDLMQEHFANPVTLSSQARVTPYIVQGERQGFRLSRLQPNSLLQRIGLQHGDVLQKVNGQGITSTGDVLQAYQQLQQAGTVRLEILRQNRPTTLTYEIR